MSLFLIETILHDSTDSSQETQMKILIPKSLSNSSTNKLGALITSCVRQDLVISAKEGLINETVVLHLYNRNISTPSICRAWALKMNIF